MSFSSIVNAMSGGGTGSWYENPNVWNTIISAGTSLFSGIQKQDAQDRQDKISADAVKAKEDDAKMTYLLELAKLKYGSKGGGGGGGGGTKRNANADLIDVLSKGTDQSLTALDQLTKGVQGPIDAKRMFSGY